LEISLTASGQAWRSLRLADARHLSGGIEPYRAPAMTFARVRLRRQRSQKASASNLPDALDG
jgi:hypothetical protein